MAVCVNCWSCCMVMHQVCSDEVSTEDSIIKHFLEEGKFGGIFVCVLRTPVC